MHVTPHLALGGAVHIDAYVCVIFVSLTETSELQGTEEDPYYGYYCYEVTDATDYDLNILEPIDYPGDLLIEGGSESLQTFLMVTVHNNCRTNGLLECSNFASAVIQNIAGIMYL